MPLLVPEPPEIGGRFGGILAERARPATVRRSPRAPWLAVATVCLGAFLGQLDASVVTSTLPALRTGFRSSPAAVEWVSLGYLVVLVALLVPVGRLSDALGRKAVYLLGFAVFTAASVGCGLAPALWVLVAARVAQAFGAAMLQANSVALISTGVPAGRLRAALGVQAAAQALGLALGPTVGGLLVDGPGWRWVFLVNVPVGVLGMVAGRYLLPRTRHRHPVGRFDAGGVALLATATTAALLALSAGAGLGVPVAVPGLVAAGAAAAFAVRQRRAADPLVPPGLLRDRAVGGGLLAACLGYLVLFGPLVVGPYALAAAGVTGAGAGMYLTSLPAGFALAALLGGRVLPRRWGNRARGAVGLGLAGLGMAAVAATPVGPAGLCAAFLCTGVGLGVFTPANNAAVLGAVPAARSGTAGGLVNTARALGTALGVAVVTLALRAGGDRGIVLSTGLIGFSAMLAGVVTLASAAGNAPAGRR